MKVLRLSKDTFDYDAEFRVEGVQGNVSLHKDMVKIGDGILWGLQSGAMVKSHYSAEEKAHNDRMRKSTPIQNGEKVIIDGKVYVARILGNYSDCVVFDPETV